jgi:sarcosine oxidase
VKVALHTPGPNLDEDGDQVARTIECARHRLSNVGTEPTETGICIYTNTEDEGFRIFWHDPSNLVVAACSGHAFKFGPWLGWFATQLVEQPELLADYPEFAP